MLNSIIVARVPFFYIVNNGVAFRDLRAFVPKFVLVPAVYVGRPRARFFPGRHLLNFTVRFKLTRGSARTAATRSRTAATGHPFRNIILLKVVLRHVPPQSLPCPAGRSHPAPITADPRAARRPVGGAVELWRPRFPSPPSTPVGFRACNAQAPRGRHDSPGGARHAVNGSTYTKATPRLDFDN